jgi:hypothetical protein
MKWKRNGDRDIANRRKADIQHLAKTSRPSANVVTMY